MYQTCRVFRPIIHFGLTGSLAHIFLGRFLVRTHGVSRFNCMVREEEEEEGGISAPVPLPCFKNVAAVAIGGNEEEEFNPG